MKFRGKLVDISCIQHFSRVVNSMAKLTKSCTIRITTSKMYFILPEKVSNGNIKIWCEINPDHFFNEYRMDGVSAQANEIFLEVSIENVVQAFRTAQCAMSVKVKLTRKVVPCLTFEVEQPSMNADSRMVIHDVPVSVIPQRLWDEYQEPILPHFDVSIYLPPLRVVRSVIDRMKNLHNFVTVSANQEGKMVLKIDTDSVTICTKFNDLLHPMWTGERTSQDRNRDPKVFASARVDIRKFSQFLSGKVVPENVLCNIVDNQTLQFFLLHDDVTLQYFLPVVSI